MLLSKMIVFITLSFMFTTMFETVLALLVPLGSKISVVKRDYWVSANGNFALGFFNHSDLANQYGVGIRFNSPLIPAQDHVFVWVAGADVHVGKDSFLHFTDDGDLILFDGLTGVAAWSSNTSQSSVVSAALLDDGNFVLRNGDGVAIWQSFSTPSDSLLPGQNLTSSQMLRAAGKNAISSYYSLSINHLGQLVLRWETNVSYWRTDAAASSPILAAIFANTGSLELLDQVMKPVWSTFGDDHNDSSVRFRFLRLDVDGNLRMYSWSEASKSWRSAWQAVENQCNVFATCGLRGVCAFTSEGTAECRCPFLSSPHSATNCLTPYKQKCSSGTSMMTLQRMFLYGIYPPHDIVTKTSLEGCKNSCLADPLCTSVTWVDDGTAQCFIKMTQFVTGYEDPSLASTSFVKICLDPLAAIPELFPTPPATASFVEDSQKSCKYCFIGATTGIFLILFVIHVVVGVYFLRRRKANKKAGLDVTLNSVGVVSLSYSEIKNLTHDFKNQLSPNLFKGVLPCNRVIVVKDLKDVLNIDEKQFRCWISVLASMYHKNLVKLEAYCYQAEQRYLVYQFAKNGSVDRWITEAKLAKRLNWSKRMEICLGVARAIAYLHSGCREFVNHGNLKWRNVVLDEDLDAKVTEYGLRRFAGGPCQAAYPAEEDVAMFGEMLVVLVTGRQGGSEVSWWAYKEWVEGRGNKLVDSRMGGKADFQEVERTLRLAFWCVQDDKRLRPSMGEITKVLEGALAVDPPPPPCRIAEAFEESTTEKSESSCEVKANIEVSLAVDTLPPPNLTPDITGESEIENSDSDFEVMKAFETIGTFDPSIGQTTRKIEEITVQNEESN